MNTEYFSIYVVSCKNTPPFILLESRWFCTDCNDWHEAQEVGDFRVEHFENGTIQVTGNGWFDQKTEAAR